MIEIQEDFIALRFCSYIVVHSHLYILIEAQEDFIALYGFVYNGALSLIHLYILRQAGVFSSSKNNVLNVNPCLFVLILNVQFNNSMSGQFPGLNLYYAAEKVSCSRTQYSDSAGGESQTPQTPV